MASLTRAAMAGVGRGGVQRRQSRWRANVHPLAVIARTANQSGIHGLSQQRCQWAGNASGIPRWNLGPGLRKQGGFE